MDLKDYCIQLAQRITSLKEQISTEEATKNAFIMPFIQMLGYDVFNPLEVIPEMDCDLIKKKGDKIDYAIMNDGEPIILIECKHWQQNLNLHDNQLQKYFVASKAKFGVLTNGIVYRFYTDLEKANIMDSVPFLEIDMEQLTDNSIEELKKFHKSYFNIDNILSTANELKYMSELKSAIKTEFVSPSSDFVRFFAKKIYNGVVNQKVIDRFTELVKRSLNNHINDVISDRLNVAIKAESTAKVAVATDVEEPQEISRIDRIVTTEEELEGYYIVKSILRTEISPERITYRDNISYFAIFIDDNNRKPVCRLRLNRKSVKYIELITDDKKEVKHQIESIDDIYKFKNEIVESAIRYK